MLFWYLHFTFIRYWFLKVPIIFMPKLHVFSTQSHKLSDFFSYGTMEPATLFRLLKCLTINIYYFLSTSMLNLPYLGFHPGFWKIILFFWTLCLNLHLLGNYIFIITYKYDCGSQQHIWNWGWEFEVWHSEGLHSFNGTVYHASKTSIL